MGKRKYRTTEICRNHFVKIIISYYTILVHYLEGIDEHWKGSEEENSIMKCYYWKYYFDIGIYVFIEIIYIYICYSLDFSFSLNPGVIFSLTHYMIVLSLYKKIKDMLDVNSFKKSQNPYFNNFSAWPQGGTVLKVF